LIVTRFTDTMSEVNLAIELYAANTTEISEACQTVMRPEFGRVGIELEKFNIENVSMSEELKKEISEFRCLNKLDMTKLAQFKFVKAMELAATNLDSMAGAEMGFVLTQQNGSFNAPTLRSAFWRATTNLAACFAPACSASG
jgi:membrane protease subunit (stomatin/prohibitin family)